MISLFNGGSVPVVRQVWNVLRRRAGRGARARTDRIVIPLFRRDPLSRQMPDLQPIRITDGDRREARRLITQQRRQLVQTQAGRDAEKIARLERLGMPGDVDAVMREGVERSSAADEVELLAARLASERSGIVYEVL